MAERRQFLKTLGRAACATAATVGGLAVYGRHLAATPVRLRVEGEPSVVRPPGAVGESAFLASCARCQCCHDACPSDAIRLAGPGDPVQRDTPFVVTAEDACTLCLRCTTACPTGALRPVLDAEDVRMGVAVVDERTCVSHNGTGVCGACHTACPFRNLAITQGMRNRPVVHEDHCVGCGLCEEACILHGTKAIRVFSEREVA